ncbi:MAG: dTDP-4-dehydrorhamnose reductase [Planctomycetota bacterium]|jgi:dTDP-4-dehydrorhamnose reductase
MTDADKPIVVLGGRGMLGTDIARMLGQKGIGVQVLDLPEFDITNDKQLGEAVAGRETIINCAAYTNVEKAESEPELAYKVNAEAAGRLGEFAKAAGAHVAHISTDFVFDGTSDKPYVETDATNPINAYGRTKLGGEQLLAESGCRFCVIRVEWTYGLAGNNFVKKLIERAESGRPLKVVDDQIGSPTATVEVARAICKLLANLPEGIFHFAAAGYASRFEMAQFIFDKLGMSVDLTSCKSTDFVTAATRPLNSRFDCSKIEAALGELIKPWQGPLEHFLEQL